ncbi:hypothetical protein QR680_006965 [Steinernema hermaphroditum]|uniref:Uncharacterized protein n=1 Tax=Steinernema hermaphroditum TaxID=289476 RepID=A0AA39LY92_9BILA|nr:hypothetical protein QR680_006965 [Steinernema hermaphroditum]
MQHWSQRQKKLLEEIDELKSEKFKFSQKCLEFELLNRRLTNENTKMRKQLDLIEELPEWPEMQRKIWRSAEQQAKNCPQPTFSLYAVKEEPSDEETGRAVQDVPSTPTDPTTNGGTPAMEDMWLTHWTGIALMNEKVEVTHRIACKRSGHCDQSAAQHRKKPKQKKEDQEAMTDRPAKRKYVEHPPGSSMESAPFVYSEDEEAITNLNNALQLEVDVNMQLEHSSHDPAEELSSLPTPMDSPTDTRSSISTSTATSGNTNALWVEHWPGITLTKQKIRVKTLVTHERIDVV